MVKESPQYIKLSLAGSMTLGFTPGRFWRDAEMYCINLLLHYEDGCKANCSYCGLSKNRIADERTFIHVPWPLKHMDDVIKKLNESDIAKRICISMVTHKRAGEDTLFITERLVKETKLPVSILMGPTTTDKEYLKSLKKAGAEKIGIAIDAATPELFDNHRGKGVKGPHKWETYWERFKEAVEVFEGKNVGSHFVVGLGEKEIDMVRSFQEVRNLGGVNHLFSFFSEDGTSLSDMSQPSISNYRRVQIACDIIDAGLSSFQDFKFNPDTGIIIDFGISQEKLNALINSGEPFRTRGCKGCDGEVDCNRTFGNSFPGPELRNYPFPPTKEDLSIIRKQIFSPDQKKKKITFSVPNLKKFNTDSYSNLGKSTFLAYSVTASKCELNCEHCKAELLKPMIDAASPEILLEKVLLASKSGTKGILVSGGCDKNGVVPLAPFAEVIKRIKNQLGLITAVHTKFVNEEFAEAFFKTGLDSVMVDIVSDNVLKNIYHLKNKSSEDIRDSLDIIEKYSLPLSPHILTGLDNVDGEDDNTFDEMDLLNLLKGRDLKSLVFVFLMPLPSTSLKNAEPVPLSKVNRIFAAARRYFPDTPLYLGCARPPGKYQVKLDTLALKHGFDGIAFPCDEVVNIARKRKYEIKFDECCCALMK
jgi:lipoyl synthase